MFFDTLKRRAVGVQFPLGGAPKCQYANKDPDTDWLLLRVVLTDRF